jgi:DNA gyrase subunit A
MQNYNFSERQAKAILDLKLNRLVNMEIAKIQQEKEKLEEEIKHYNILLTNEQEFLKVIEENLKEVSLKYGDDRRTLIDNIEEEAPIVEEKGIIAYISNSGAIVAKNLDNIVTQNRRRIGEKIKFSNKKDTIWKTIIGKNTEQVLVFTNFGKSYSLKLSDLPIDEEIYITQLLDFKPNEYITNILSYDNAKKYKYVIFATKNGILKKTKIEEYLNGSNRKSGLIAIKVQDNDLPINTQLIENDEEIVLVSAQGRCLRFNHNLITPTGRNTIGMKGINLAENDNLIDMQVINKNAEELILITKKGYGKRIKLDEILTTNRAIKGNLICKFKDEDDSIAAFTLISSSEKEVIINSKLSSLKIKISDIPLLGKYAMGLQLIKIVDKNFVKNILILEK